MNNKVPRLNSDHPGLPHVQRESASRVLGRRSTSAAKMAGQPGLFDLSDRYAALSVENDPLERLSAVIDFEVSAVR